MYYSVHTCIIIIMPLLCSVSKGLGFNGLLPLSMYKWVCIIVRWGWYKEILSIIPTVNKLSLTILYCCLQSDTKNTTSIKYERTCSSTLHNLGVYGTGTCI